MVPPPTNRARHLLRLTLTPGVGPVLAQRLLERFPEADQLAKLAPADVQRVHGIGAKLAPQIASGLRESERLTDAEIETASRLNIRLIARGEPDYPPLLAHAPAAPPILYVKGDPRSLFKSYTVAVVGSRHCTPYGVEQAERFSAFLASAGLAIISGGVRGIDSAAHRAALRVNGATAAVLGCGLAHIYPPENADLFEAILSGNGAIVSELPLSVAPSSDNFPARNRIISALSLGVLVIEAPRGSGALITAKYAVEDHNREVMAIPGRIDSPASEGSNDLIKSGTAALVSAPADVLDHLETQARHLFQGTHADRYASPNRSDDGGLFGAGTGTTTAPIPLPEPQVKTANLSPTQLQVIEALASPLRIDDLLKATGLSAAQLRSDLTILELRRVVVREGGRFARKV